MKKIYFQIDLLNYFLKKYNIEYNHNIVNKISSFGYELINDNFVICIPDNEKILGPITICFVLNYFKSYDDFILHIRNNNSILIKNLKLNSKLTYGNYVNYNNTKEFINHEFGSFIVPLCFLELIKFFNEYLQIDYIVENISYNLPDSIQRRINLTYENEIFGIQENYNKNEDIINLENVLCKSGFKEIIIHPIINYYKKDNNLKIIENKHNVINGFMQRNYLISHLLESYIDDFDKFYFKEDKVFTIENIFNVNEHKTYQNILVTKKFSHCVNNLNWSFYEEINNIIFLFGKKANFYLVANGNIKNIFIHYNKVGICIYYKQRICIEMYLEKIKNLPDLEKVTFVYDYNINCKNNDINIILENIMKQCNKILFFKIVDIFKNKEIYRYTVKIFLSEKINYNIIYDIIAHYQ